MIARTLAETGVKDLMLSLHGLCKRNNARAQIIKMSGRYVSVDPRNWRTRTSMVVNVGGANRQATLQGLTFLLQAQEKAVPLGLTDDSRIFNSLAEVSKALGFKNVHKFWIDPKQRQTPPAPPKPDPAIESAKIMAEGQVAAEQVKAASDERQGAAQNDTKMRIALLQEATKALIAASKEETAQTLEPQRLAVQGEMRRLQGPYGER